MRGPAAAAAKRAVPAGRRRSTESGVSFWSFVILIAAGTLLAALIGGLGDFLIARGMRKAARGDEHPRPDPLLAWGAIRTEARRRIKAAERLTRVERLVRRFLAEIAEYRRITGEDPGPARQYLAEAIARELAEGQTPAVLAALRHAQRLLAELPDDGAGRPVVALPPPDPRA